MRNDGTECNAKELGRITVKLPLPPGTMSTLYKAPDRFVQTYFSRFEVRIESQMTYLFLLRKSLYVLRNFLRAITTPWMPVIKTNIIMYT